MDQSNSLNSTQNAQDSQNPQDTATPGASNGADFQSTAPPSTLNEETENLSVQETGDPVSGSVLDKASDALPMSWVIGIILILVVGGLIFYKLLRESIEDATAPEPTPRATKASKAKTASAPAKKTTAKKKSAPNKRKKNTKKRK